MKEEEAWLAEYKEALADIRLHSGLMFGELTVYLVASSVLVRAVLKNDPGQVPKGTIAVIGIVLSIAFFVLHERFGDFVHVARGRAKQLESQLGFELYSSSPPARRLFWAPFVTAINAARLVFVAGFAGWVLTLLWPLLRQPH